jgi:hypothetical protein
MYNENTKKSIYKWRDNNKHEWDVYHNKKEKERYEKNKDVIKEKYEYKAFLFNCSLKKEFQLFRKIEI